MILIKASDKNWQKEHLEASKLEQDIYLEISSECEKAIVNAINDLYKMGGGYIYVVEEGGVMDKDTFSRLSELSHQWNARRFCFWNDEEAIKQYGHTALLIKVFSNKRASSWVGSSLRG